MRRVPAVSHVHKDDGPTSFPEPPSAGVRRIPGGRAARQRHRRRHCFFCILFVLALLLTAALVRRRTHGLARQDAEPTGRPTLAPIPLTTSIPTPPSTSSSHIPKPSTSSTHPTTVAPTPTASTAPHMAHTTPRLCSAADGFVPLALVAVETYASKAGAAVQPIACVDLASLTNATYAPASADEGSARRDARGYALPSDASFMANLRASTLTAEGRQGLLPAMDVQLLRQRLTRSQWSTPSSLSQRSGDLVHHSVRRAAQWPIISLDPQEGLTSSDDTALYFPSEVLVEEYGDGDTGSRQRADPQSSMPAWFEDDSHEKAKAPVGASDSAKAAWSGSVRVYTSVPGDANHAVETDSRLLPVLEVRTASSLPDAVAASLPELVLNGTVVQWLLHTAPTHEKGATDLTVSSNARPQSFLSLARPRVYAQLHRAEKTSLARLFTAAQSRRGSTARQHTENPTAPVSWTSLIDADPSIPRFPLAGTFWLPQVRRLWGFAPRPSWATTEAKSDADDAETNADVSFSAEIPLNGFREYNLVMGAAPHVSSSAPASAGTSSASAGVVPLIIAELDPREEAAQTRTETHTPSHITVGILWLNSAPVWIDTATSTETQVTRLSVHTTGGATRLFLLPGPTLADVLRQYYTLTGFPTLPPRHALGLQHGYVDATQATQSALIAHSLALLSEGVPADGILCTAEAVHKPRVPFSFESSRFADPIGMQSALWQHGRRYLYVRNEPTIPVRQHLGLYMEARSHGYFVSEDPDDEKWLRVLTQEGEVAHVVDFSNRRARHWYGGTHKYKRFEGSTNYTLFFLQNAAPVLSDGAQQSVRGMTLPMHAGHHGGFFHRDLHNAYNFLYALASSHGTLRRSRYFRRAVLWTENFFVGVQRVGVVAYRGAVGVVIDTQPNPNAANSQEPQGNKHDEAAQRPAALLTWLYEGGVADKHNTPGVAHAIVNAAWSSYRQGLGHILSLGLLGLPFASANVADGSFYLHELIALSVAAASEARASKRTGDAADANVDAFGDGDLVTALLQLEEVSLRWYQLGVVMPLLHSEGLYDAAASFLSSPSSPSAAEQCGAFFFLPNTLTSPEVRTALVVVMGDKARGDGSATAADLLTRWQGLDHLAQGSVRLRYALLPYLYTTAWRTSVVGTPFWLPLPAEGATSDTTNMCFAVGTALLACPPTQPSFAVRGDRDVPQPQRVKLPPLFAPLTTRLDDDEPETDDVPGRTDVWYDFWSGVPHRAAEVVTLPIFDAHTAFDRPAANRSAGNGQWLVEPAVRAAGAADAGVTVAADGVRSSVPLFQAAGSIVVTQNIYRALPAGAGPSASQGTRGPATSMAIIPNADTPTNFTLTVALPSLHSVTAALRTQPWRADVPHIGRARHVRVATGELIWDDGQSNFQVAPPPASEMSAAKKDKEGFTAPLPAEAFCRVQITCDVMETELTTSDTDTKAGSNAVSTKTVFSLVLAGSQVGPDCARALRTWTSRHDDLATGFAEYFSKKAAASANDAWKDAMAARRRDERKNAGVDDGTHSPSATAGKSVNSSTSTLPPSAPAPDRDASVLPANDTALREDDVVQKFWDGQDLSSMHLITQVRLLLTDADDWKAMLLPSTVTHSLSAEASVEKADDERSAEGDDSPSGEDDSAHEETTSDEHNHGLSVKQEGAAAAEEKTASPTTSHLSHLESLAQHHHAVLNAVHRVKTTASLVDRYVFARSMDTSAAESRRAHVLMVDLVPPRRSMTSEEAAPESVTYASSSWLNASDVRSQRVPMFGAVANTRVVAAEKNKKNGGDDATEHESVHISSDGSWRMTCFFSSGV